MTMDEIIARVTRGVASEEEGEALRAWRAGSPDNERQYRELVRILREANEIMWEEVADDPPPSVDAILSRDGAPVPGAAPSDLRPRSRLSQT